MKRASKLKAQPEPRAIRPGDTAHPRLLWFSYHASTVQAKAVSRYKSNRIDYSRSLHNVRDGGPFAYLMSVLLGVGGLEWGGLLLNLPGKDFPGEPPAILDSIRPMDLVVCPTRPPLSDQREAAQRRAQRSNARSARIIDQSGTELEGRVFRTVERFFLHYCSRSKIQLTDALSRIFGDDRADELQFMQNDSASFARKWARDRGLKGPELTAGFVLFCPRLLGGDGRLLCLWGMGGTESLFLGHAFSANPTLREMLRGIVGSPDLHFMMLQWPSNLSAPSRPTSLTFMQSQAALLVPVVHVKARIPKVSAEPNWGRA
jgi:hypothetical protein